MSELKNALINISEEVRTKVIPENIKAGANIFGVDGSYMGETDTLMAELGEIGTKIKEINGEGVPR